MSDCETCCDGILHLILGAADLTVVSEMDANGKWMDMEAVTDGPALVLKLHDDAEQADCQARICMYASHWRSVAIFGL